MADTSKIDWTTLDSFSFGDSPELADCLGALVLQGNKRATCWPANQGRLTEIGKLMVMRDGSGRPRAIIETIELTERRFSEVDDAFAFDEGEGDRTLESWRAAHQSYFERQGNFAPDMLLYCERFRLIERIDPSGRQPDV
jgi:uncharacterized protein YhfF